MAITPITKNQRVRNFLTYDLEWAKGTPEHSDTWGLCHRPQVRMAGVYDGTQYRWWRTIEGFLNGVLVSANRGKWFYAHAGGLADMLFVLEYLIDRPDYEVKASFSGSSAIIVHVKKGKNVWHFVDSYWLLKDKLANIGKFIGIEKGDVDSFDDTPMAELIPYNKLDCEILWKAIDAFESALLEIGGQLQMTLASSAMYLFRRKFLRERILTSPWVNERAAESYFASRVEVFQTRCKDAFYYDINSSFPYAMTKPCPGNLWKCDRRLFESRLDDGALFTADLDVEVPEEYFPGTPKRYKQSVFFPVGKWRGWFTSVDVELLLRKGGKIHKVHEVMHFHPFEDLSDYAQTLYERRRSSTTKFEKKVYKLLLNSLYGKFAEGESKQVLILHPLSFRCPHEPRCPMHEMGRPLCFVDGFLLAGGFLLEKQVSVAHRHVPISAHITAYARRTLFDYMDKCEDFHYCDTDGFSTTEEGLPTSDKLGDLKLEEVIKNGRFIRPKVYRINDKVRAKGFTLKPDRDELREIPKEKQEKFIRRHSVKQWMDLINGGTLEMRRFTRVRELYRKGERRPTERIVKKRLTGNARKKRPILKDGNTRPWHVSELEE